MLAALGLLSQVRRSEHQQPAVLYCTVLHCTALYSTAMHSGKQLLCWHLGASPLPHDAALAPLLYANARAFAVLVWSQC
jgi:hypothetical protein